MLIEITDEQVKSLRKLKEALDILDSFVDAENPGPSDEADIMIDTSTTSYELTYDNGANRVQLGVLRDVAAILGVLS